MTRMQRWLAGAVIALGVDAGSALAQSVPPPTDLSSLDLTVRHRVRAVHFAPSDRPFPPGIHGRLDALIRLTRQFYREEMARWGYLDSSGRGKTFVIDQADDGLWDVVFMVGQHPASHYQAFADTGGACLSEIFARIPAAFHNDNVTVYFYDTFTVQGDTFAHTGNGGSGAPWEGEGAGYVLQGTHFLGAGFDTVAIDPADQAALFLDTAPSGIRDYAWNGQHRLLTRGEFASTYLGVPIHEIGHAFYLGHVFSDTDGDGVENNLMGNGFRRFGGRYGMPGPDAHPTILAPESAAQLDTALMFNQPDPFDISASTHPLVWR